MENDRQKLILIIGMIGFLATSIPLVANAATLILSATEDAGILDGDSANDPFPGILYSELDTAPDATLAPGNIWMSFLKFDLNSLTGMRITSATFELTSNFNHSPLTFSHEVYSSSNDSWTEGTITGINRPFDSTLTLLDSTNIDGTSQTYSWNVLSGVAGPDGVPGPNNVLSLVVRPELSQAGSGVLGPHFNDRNFASGSPRLIINANPVPVPAAVWFFGSALIGLFGLKHRI